MTPRAGVALSACVLLLLTACSSSSPDPKTSTASVAPKSRTVAAAVVAATITPTTTPTIAATPSVTATETTPTAPPVDPTITAARAWMNMAPHRLDVELMIATAVQVRNSGGRDAGLCSQLTDAVFALDDEFPHFKTPANRNSMMQALLDAGTKFNLASSACSTGISYGVTANLRHGFAAVSRAEKIAKKIRISI